MARDIIKISDARLNLIRVAFALLAVSMFGSLIWLALGYLHVIPQLTLYQDTIFVSAAATILHLVIPYVFHLGLSKFKPELRHSYRLMFIGIVLLAASYGQTVVITLAYAWNSFWVTYGLIALPFLLSVLFIYAGVRAFARILRISTLATSFIFTGTVGITVGAICAYLTYLLRPASDVSAWLSAAIVGWDTVFFSVAALVAGHIRRTASAQYTNALAWLAVGLWAYMLASIHYLIVIMCFGTDGNWYYTYNMPIIALSAAAFVLAQAAFAFVRIGQATPGRWFTSFFGGQIASNPDRAVSLIDIIVYMAQQVSDPRAVDHDLDVMRSITADMRSGETLTVDDQEHLAELYLKLEDYLTIDEPLRIYTQQDLRLTTYAKFYGSTQTYTPFWNIVKPAAA